MSSQLQEWKAKAIAKMLSRIDRGIYARVIQDLESHDWCITINTREGGTTTVYNERSVIDYLLARDAVLHNEIGPTTSQLD